MSALSPAECRQLQRAFAAIDGPALVGADVVAAALGLTHYQLKRRLREGDLAGLHDRRHEVLALGRQVRSALKLHTFNTAGSITSNKVL
jgi:hypothetical protein